MSQFAITEQKTRIVSLYYFIFMMVSVIVFVFFVGIISAFYQYSRDKHFDSSKWFDLQKICITCGINFDRSLMGRYYLQTALCATDGAIFLILQIPVFSFFVSVCLYLQALCFNLKLFYNDIDELTNDRRNPHQFKIRKLLCKIIQFEIDMET